jgi:hypothetical protein
MPDAVHFSKFGSTDFMFCPGLPHCGDRIIPQLSIIFGIGANLWSKQSSNSNSPLMHVCTGHSASAIVKCILEVIFFEGVPHRLCFCRDHFICIKMVSSVRETKLLGDQVRHVGWVGCDSHVVSGKKTSLLKRKCEKCAVMMQQLGFVAKIWSKVFTHYHVCHALSQ